MNTAWLRIGFLGAACCLGAAPAYAQGVLGPGMAATGRAAPAKDAKQPPPPALPGSRAETTAVAPASKPALDMPPTDALFDAINRGDLAAAKDALGRGADLNGHNVLGLTPLDLAVDLGRNEITFVLLSMRSTESPAPEASPPPVATAEAKPQAERRRSRHQFVRRQEDETVTVHSAGYSSATRRNAAEAQAPRLFAGDGGAPNPSAGFLGFGSSR